MHNVYITGFGFATSMGVNRDKVINSLRELRHGFSLKRLPETDVETNGDDSPCAGIELVSGEVEGFDISSPDFRDWCFPGSQKFDSALLRALPPHGRYAVTAL